MGKDDFYVDDSECTENNYRTKKIDAPINCGICEYLSFSKNVVPDTVMYSCKKQNPNRWDDDLNRLYRGCPLPKATEKPDLLSRIQKIEGAVTNLSGLLCEKIEKVESRVTLVEKCVQEIIDERDESIRYENFDRLQSENAQLKEKIDSVNSYYKKALDSLSDLQSELESLKKNQLSKDELRTIMEWYWVYWYSYLTDLTSDCKSALLAGKLNAKLESMEGL